MGLKYKIFHSKIISKGWYEVYGVQYEGIRNYSKEDTVYCYYGILFYY